jgi:outer membrane protein W
MKNKTTKLLITSALALSAFTANAATSGDQWVGKARLGYLHLSDDVKVGSASTATVHTVKNGAVGEVALTYAFNDPTYGLELGLGYGRTKFKNNAGNSKSTHFVPVTAMFQLRHAGDSATPYLGIGYQYQVMGKGDGGAKMKNGGGLTIGAGVDFLTAGSDLGFNVDVKYTHNANHRITETSGGSEETFSNKMSSATAMAGLTFAF